jgi:NDP-sugar pyrophosphorylase family protein
VKITYALEAPEILGTAGGMKNFDGMLKGNFLVLYADTFYRMDYSKLTRFYALLKDPIGVATVRKTDHPMDSDLAVLDAHNRIVEFRLKPHKELPKEYWGSSAPYIFHTGILKFIPPKQYYEIDHNLVPDLLSRGYSYYGYPLGEGEFRRDVGTPERYKEMEEYLKKQSQK